MSQANISRLFSLAFSRKSDGNIPPIFLCECICKSLGNFSYLHFTYFLRQWGNSHEDTDTKTQIRRCNSFIYMSMVTGRYLSDAQCCFQLSQKSRWSCWLLGVHRPKAQYWFRLIPLLERNRGYTSLTADDNTSRHLEMGDNSRNFTNYCIDVTSCKIWYIFNNRKFILGPSFFQLVLYFVLAATPCCTGM